MKYADPEFPKLRDILAIISIESGFNPLAVNKKSRGLMQVNNSPLSLDENVKRGVALAKEYYELLKQNKRSTLLAYNAGIGNFLKGRYDSAYWERFKNAEHDLQIVERNYGDSGGTDPTGYDFRWNELCGSPRGRILPKQWKAGQTVHSERHGKAPRRR